MIADTTFLIHFHQEGRTGRGGPARMFFADHRREVIRTSVISLAEIAPSFRRSLDAWQYFDGWKVYPLHLRLVSPSKRLALRQQPQGNRAFNSW